VFRTLTVDRRALGKARVVARGVGGFARELTGNHA